MTDQRHFRRVPFQAEVKVLFAGREHSCELVNLALTGALLRIPQEISLRTGDSCHLSIFLPASDLTLEFEAELVRCDGVDFGFRFVGEDDTTLGHLRRLLELNLGDAEQVEAEFIAWLKE